MNTFATSEGRRDSLVLTLLMWVLASLATATVAHAAIAWVCGDGDGSAFAGYAHVAVVPIALGAFAVACVLVVNSALHRLARSRAVDPVLALAHHVRAADPAVLWIAVCAGGIAALLGMEFCEQFVALGHIESVQAAFGGAPLAGLALVLASAAVVTGIGLRCARSLLETAGSVVLAVVAWIGRAARDLADAATILRSRPARHGRCDATFSPQCVSLRAPPRRSR